MHRELEDHLGEIKDENDMLKDRVRKLKTVFNGLSEAHQEKKATKKQASFGASKVYSKSITKVFSYERQPRQHSKKTGGFDPSKPACPVHNSVSFY